MSISIFSNSDRDCETALLQPNTACRACDSVSGTADGKDRITVSSPPKKSRANAGKAAAGSSGSNAPSAPAAAVLSAFNCLSTVTTTFYTVLSHLVSFDLSLTASQRLKLSLSHLRVSKTLVGVTKNPLS